jgi:hypothetical protein
MNVFEKTLFIKFLKINSHVLMIYYEPYHINIYIYIQHQIKLPLLNVKD